MNCAFVKPSSGEDLFWKVSTLNTLIKEGEELFICYGPEYEFRDYEVSQQMEYIYFEEKGAENEHKEFVYRRFPFQKNRE